MPMNIKIYIYMHIRKGQLYIIQSQHTITILKICIQQHKKMGFNTLRVSPCLKIPCKYFVVNKGIMYN